MAAVRDRDRDSGAALLQATVAIVIGGQSNVGKTTLIKRLQIAYASGLDACGIVQTDATVGVDFATWDLLLPDRRRKVKLTFWDVGGDDRFENVVDAYFRGKQGFILVYDLTASATFEKLATRWLPLIDRHNPDR